MKQLIARAGLFLFIGFNCSVPNAAGIGDLLITELMINPVALADSQGEWIELYNPTDSEINLRDHQLRDDGSDLHRFDTDLLILPLTYLTLARGANPGFTPDYVYDRFTLANGADEIVFSDAAGDVLRLDYRSGFAAPGRSMELIRAAVTPDAYLPTAMNRTYGAGDVGTPGLPGSLRFSHGVVSEPAAVWLLMGGIGVLGLLRLNRSFPRIGLKSGLKTTHNNMPFCSVVAA